MGPVGIEYVGAVKSAMVAMLESTVLPNMMKMKMKKA